MSQHDLDIANQTASNARADINNALQALGSLNSGTSAPATTYANMLWYDTTNNTLKMRAEANDAWISVGYLDQSADAFRIFDDTQVVNSSGTQTGIIGDQTTGTWETGTGTTESLVSPAKVKAAVEALAPIVPSVLIRDEVSTNSTYFPPTNSWITTKLNTVDVNTISASLTSDVITLPAGTYYVEYNLPTARVASDTLQVIATRFRNTTDSTTVINGQTLALGDWQQVNQMGVGTFTISGTKSFELQVWAAEQAALRYGYTGSGEPLVFSIVKIFKVG